MGLHLVNTLHDKYFARTILNIGDSVRCNTSHVSQGAHPARAVIDLYSLKTMSQLFCIFSFQVFHQHSLEEDTSSTFPSLKSLN